MPISQIETVGQRTVDRIGKFGDFCLFCGQSLFWSVLSTFSARTWRLILPQLFEVGVKSVPVVAITGAFIGMVLSIETHAQFKSIGQENRLGGVINISVVKQIGPVLAAVMLSGRVGGALTAELGTMNVTEQIAALRVMGSDPIRYLVVPRFLACMLLSPVLTMYSNMLGVGGAWLVSTQFLGVPNDPYWSYSAAMVDKYQVFEGLIKSVFFGGAIGLISCYKGFTCGAGASGVGRACTEAFVASFIAIIIINFFLAKLSQDWYVAIYGVRSVFG
jgi:phospholipid/cholesterol/gamma-HCH transport system permease protein